MAQILQRLLAAFLALFGLLPAVPAQTQTPPPANAALHPLTVMSYNVYVVDDLIHSHEKRAPGVIANLREAMPDDAFVGRGRDKEETAGEFSPVFYKTEKYTLEQGGTFWFSDTPDAPSRTWGSRYNRICSWAALTEKESGFSFAVFNSHWDHLSVVSRNRSAALLLEKAAGYAPGLPVVITGDFNCKNNTVAYKTLIDGGFVDAMAVSPETDDTGTFHGYYKITTKGELPIDHILFPDSRGCGKSYRVIADKRNGAYPSDHFPILAEIVLY